jgi:Animal haem peroxidase
MKKIKKTYNVINLKYKTNSMKKKALAIIAIFAIVLLVLRTRAEQCTVGPRVGELYYNISGQTAEADADALPLLQGLFTQALGPTDHTLSVLPFNQIFYYWGEFVHHDLSAPGSASCNLASAALDGSFVYGNTAAEQKSRRSFVHGKMLLNQFGELPPDLPGPGPGPGPVTLQLLALRTLFVMEHNRHCEQILAGANRRARRSNALDDNDIFVRARQIVIFTIQKITFEEWLPFLIPEIPTPTSGVGLPRVLAETVVLRSVMHGMAGNQILYSDQNQELHAEPLAVGFDNPREMHRVLSGADGVCSVLSGMLREPLYEIGTVVAADLYNLTSTAILNVTYAKTAAALSRNISNITALTRDLAKVSLLRSWYGNATDAQILAHLPLLAGLALEDHLPGQALGPVARELLWVQFVNYTRNPMISAGIWYETSKAGLSKRQRDGIRKLTLAEILSKNCYFIEDLNATTEFHLWAVSDVKIVEKNNPNLNTANEAALITFVVILAVIAAVLFALLFVFMNRYGISREPFAKGRKK